MIYLNSNPNFVRTTLAAALHCPICTSSWLLFKIRSRNTVSAHLETHRIWMTAFEVIEAFRLDSDRKCETLISYAMRMNCVAMAKQKSIVSIVMRYTIVAVFTMESSRPTSAFFILGMHAITAISHWKYGMQMTQEEVNKCFRFVCGLWFYEFALESPRAQGWSDRSFAVGRWTHLSICCANPNRISMLFSNFLFNARTLRLVEWQRAWWNRKIATAKHFAMSKTFVVHFLLEKLQAMMIQ